MLRRLEILIKDDASVKRTLSLPGRKRSVTMFISPRDFYARFDTTVFVANNDLIVEPLGSFRERSSLARSHAGVINNANAPADANP